jgi:hypothetical protein
MAVGVTDDPETDQVVHSEAGLLAQLPPRGALGGFPPFDPSAGELPEPGKKARRGPALDEPPAAVRQDDHRCPDLRALAASPSHGYRPRVAELAVGTAGIGDRTGRAGRPLRTADGLAKFHHRLVEGPRFGPGEDRFEGPFEADSDPGVPHVPFLSGPAGCDPQPVRLQRDHRPAESDRGDRPRDVRTDPGQRFELRDGGREFSSAFADDVTGRSVEAMGPRVVAGPLPELEDPFGPRPRERFEGGERMEEPLEVRDRLVDAGLLQEDLRHPDPVRRSVRAPGEFSVVGPVPREKGRGERRREGRRGGGGGSHGLRSTDEAEA